MNMTIFEIQSHSHVILAICIFVNIHSRLMLEYAYLRNMNSHGLLEHAYSCLRPCLYENFLSKLSKFAKGSSPNYS